MKLIYEHYWCDPWVASGTITIPFEYSSIVDFQYFVLEEIEKHKQECIKQYGKKEGSIYYTNGYIEILGHELNVGDLESNIEDRVYTLEDWFEKNAIK